MGTQICIAGKMVLVVAKPQQLEGRAMGFWFLSILDWAAPNRF